MSAHACIGAHSGCAACSGNAASPREVVVTGSKEMDATPVATSATLAAEAA